MESIALTYNEFVKHRYVVYQLVDDKRRSREQQLDDVKQSFIKRFSVEPEIVLVGEIKHNGSVLIPKNYIYIQLDR